MIEARLRGVQSALPPAARRIGADGRPPPPDPSNAPTPIGDGRALQAGAPSIAAQFCDRGFALLDHPTAMTGWRTASADAFAQTYHPEIDAIVRERLFPGQRVEIDQSMPPVFRGRADEVIYAEGVHQDFGLVPADLERNLAIIITPERAAAWRKRYDDADVTGCVAISFWRTIELSAPLRHLPLAFCDPGSVTMDDVISDGIETGENYHIALRFNAAQRGYYYPAMRSDELLAFKLFASSKDDPAPSRLRSVFHTAFDDPAMTDDAERRHSCEHRVIVTLLAD